jgi:hypothetical protein
MPTIKYTKEQTMIYNTTTKYWATQTSNTTRVNSDAPEWLGISVVLTMIYAKDICCESSHRIKNETVLI